MQPQQSPLSPIQMLPTKWTLYEGYNVKDYKDAKPQKVLSFEQISEVIEIFSSLPHFKPSLLFSQLSGQNDSFNKLFPTLQNPQIFQSIDNIFLFRQDIYPEWEDKKNQDGSILHFIVRDIDKLDICWSQLCCMLVTENLGNEEIVNGIRLMEKMQQNTREFRIQIWFAKNFAQANVMDEDFQNALGAIKMMFAQNQTTAEEKGIYSNKKQ